MSYGFDFFVGFPYFYNRYPKIDYVLKTAAVSLPVSLSEAKQQARVDQTITVEDTYFTFLIKAATTAAENYTRRDLINKTYYAFMNCFPVGSCQGIEITRSKLQQVVSIEYLVNGVYQTVDPSIYYFTNNNDFASIYLFPTKGWPSNADSVRQAIRITFVAGYGVDSTFVPDEIRFGLLSHITFMYQQRGDSGDAGFSASIPEISLGFYDQFKIYSLGVKQEL